MTRDQMRALLAAPKLVLPTRMQAEMERHLQRAGLKLPEGKK